MNYFKRLNLFSLAYFASTTSVVSFATSTMPAIPSDITQVISHGWPQGGGMFRVIVKNTELDPCLTLESINVANDLALYSEPLCPEQLTISDRDGLAFQVPTDYDGFYWDSVTLNEHELHIDFEVFLPHASSVKAKCKVELKPDAVTPALCSPAADSALSQ